MFLPVKIQRLRINVSIKNFYEDLGKFCKTMNWKYELPTYSPNDLQSDTIIWKQKFVSFTEKSHFANNSLKEIHITFTIPSFIGPPTNNTGIFDGKKLPLLGHDHILSLLLTEKYPLHVAQTHIQSVSTIWHNNFYFRKSGYAHGCVLISGEIDGMAMNLFQQLLWNPEFVWQNAHKIPSFSLNREAFNYASENGFDFPHRALMNEMNREFLNRTSN